VIHPAVNNLLRITSTLLLWLLVNSALSQGKYQKGFLLTSSLDTVRGELSFASKVTKPTPCIFRSDKMASSREVHPSEVHGFCLENGAYYYSHLIVGSDNVFLEVLVKGYLNLFKFGGIYFIEKGDSAFFELSDEVELQFVEGHQQPQRSRNYARMLSLVTSDCPEISMRANTVPLREKPLVSLVVAYNRCKGSPANFYRVKPKR